MVALYRSLITVLAHLRIPFSEIEVFLPEVDRLVSSCVQIPCFALLLLSSRRDDAPVSRSPASPPQTFGGALFCFALFFTPVGRNIVTH